ncbi:AAA family ATPase [Alicyclobacillus mali]|uniref:Nuclease SbcCD subunit C n=1 Tax=Alicyclobacillus mali (ex Roth et al. 2021) TaxID=1123961 RepID=A0ABS0EZH8_9BACL|nr:AAA family ATPase [Alicyclobacillus mali (ex Roth et al. 2021)]MBF8376453.1 AAA family ATPase [Alicyclobacillus mali (ex Roth et al. 2021)]
MKILSIQLENFRSFTEASFQFHDTTIISGHNGAGKSTLAEAVVWCLFGTDIAGRQKQDEKLMRLGAKNMAVTVTWLIRGATVVISRTRGSRQSSTLLVNGKRAQAGQIEGWFGTAEEFLSVFVPGFFSSLEPKEAKKVLSRCVPDIPKEDVLARMAPEHAAIIHRDQFVMGLDSIEFALQKVRQELKETEEERIRLEGQCQAYQSVLRRGAPQPYVPSVTEEERVRYEAAKRELIEHEAVHGHRKERLRDLYARRESLGRAFRALRDSLPRADTRCHTCGQPLPQDKADRILQEVERKRKASLAKMKEMLEEGNAVLAEIATLESLPDDASPHPELVEFVQTMEARLKDEHYREVAYAAQVRAYEQAKEHFTQAQEDLQATAEHLEGLKQRLQALQEFRFEYLRAQHEKLNGLFHHVSIHLMDVNRETGEVRETFRIEWKGRPYRLLSYSEKIRCDIEIGRALAQAKGEAMPVYVDNAESVQRLMEETFSGQVIAAYVADGPLTVSKMPEAQGA